MFLIGAERTCDQAHLNTTGEWGRILSVCFEHVDICLSDYEHSRFPGAFYFEQGATTTLIVSPGYPLTGR